MSIKSFLKKKLVKTRIEKVLIPCLQGEMLNGRNALVTGGSSGIGFAIAENFIKNGAKVTICGRNEEKLMSAKKSLMLICDCDEDKVSTLVFDISNVQDMRTKLNKYLEGKIVDIFVNCAGTNGGNMFPNTSEEDYDRILETNLKGMYFAAQEEAKNMVKKNIHGNILNITSSSSIRPGNSPYIVSKWGERSLTLGMAKQYLPYGIIVNALAPGSTLTPMLNKSGDDDMYLDYSPAKRYAAPEEIANLATVLVSGMGRMVVGDTLYATGGAGIITYDDTAY